MTMDDLACSVVTIPSILRYFEYKHLPQPLQDVSKPFHDLAHELYYSARSSQDEIECIVGLRKLLEAKDCFVRSRLPRNPQASEQAKSSCLNT